MRIKCLCKVLSWMVTLIKLYNSVDIIISVINDKPPAKRQHPTTNNLPT